MSARRRLQTYSGLISVSPMALSPMILSNEKESVLSKCVSGNLGTPGEGGMSIADIFEIRDRLSTIVKIHLEYFL